MTASHSCARLLLASLLAAVACSPDQAGSSSTSVPQFELREMLRIGDSDDGGAGSLGRIGGVLLDADGRILVADAMNHEVRVFSGTGDFLYSFGREGEGPGEVRGPCCIAAGPDGGIWVRDVGNGRLNVYRTGDTSATYERTVLVPQEMAGARGLWESIVFSDSARLVMAGRIMVEGKGFQRGHGLVVHGEAGVPRLLSQTLVPEPSDDSLAVHMIRQRQGQNLVMSFFYQPYGPGFVTAYGPGGNWARAVTSAPHVERYAVDGTLLHALDIEVLPVPLSDRERHISDSTLAQGRSGGVEIPFSTPEYKPPLAGLKFDTEGRLWVERTTADDAPREADVFDRNGNLAMHVTWPRDVRIGLEAWVGTDRVIGVGRGEFDEPHVVVMQLEPTRPGS